MRGGNLWIGWLVSIIPASAAAVHRDLGWSLTNAEAGWLAGIMSGGYMAAVLPLVALTAVVCRPARSFLASSALNAAALRFGTLLSSDGLFPALILGEQ